MEAILIVLVVVAVLAVAGVALVSRSRSRGAVLERPAAPSPLERAGEGSSATAVLEAPEVETVPVEAPAVEEHAPTVVEEAPVEEVVEAPPARPRFRDRLGKARATIAGYVGSVLARSEITDEAWDELEEALIRADVGIGPTEDLLEAVRARVAEQKATTTVELIDAVKAELVARLSGPTELARASTPPTVWLFVGVNGVGKTTTIGKVGRRLVDEGSSVVMAAGDTFRAAAAEQLGTWAERCGATLIRGAEGGDPSSVIYDAVEAAAARGADVVLADTAGRLHTKTNLMDELAKVRRVADKGAGTVTEVLLVLDATTGQNGLQQARQFAEATEVTGVVLTKLDGSAKGGIVAAIRSELGLPVKLVGLGESAVDLVDFDAEEFVEALFAAE